MPKAHGYTRVSTEDQVENTSIATNTEAILRDFEYRWKAKGFEMGEVYVDKAVSGGKPLTSRKEGHRLNMAAERGDVIIFAKLDRGFRNTRDLLNTLEIWKARGVAVAFLDLGFDTTTPVGYMIASIMGAVAEFERARLIERIRAGVAARRRSGKAHGKAPWGTRYLKNGSGATRLEVIVEDYEIGAAICRFWQQGNSVYQIASHLLRNGITRKLPKSQRGVNRGSRAKRTEWSPSAINRTLTRFQKLQSMIENKKAKFPKGYKAQEVTT